ncbi:DUF962-domain-containing protein [Trametopsis cervina]|nr:DUF962-domain-containing protein [Trametopsis cervina]
MAVSTLFDVRKQLAFYGAYHSNPVNVLVHIFGVPLLLWSAQVLLHEIPVPQAIPEFHYTINEYFQLESNLASIWTGLCMIYYFVLDPVAAVLYLPQLSISLMTATAFAHRPNAIQTAAVIQAVSWVAQFLGHGLAEKRAPALLDNLLGAVVLAPFFVHLEILFKLGYSPALHRDIRNLVGVEITRIRKLEGDKKRASIANADS